MEIIPTTSQLRNIPQICSLFFGHFFGFIYFFKNKSGQNSNADLTMLKNEMLSLQTNHMLSVTSVFGVIHKTINTWKYTMFQNVSFTDIYFFKEDIDTFWSMFVNIACKIAIILRYLTINSLVATHIGQTFVNLQCCVFWYV